MRELDILLDFLTEFVAVFSWHRYIAEHQIRLLSTHLVEGAFGIEAGNQAIVLREEQAHVVDDFRIVVDY